MVFVALGFFVYGPQMLIAVRRRICDRRIEAKFVDDHLRSGIASLKQLINQGVTVKYLQF